MKGKYANAAEKRRAMDELERRAADAEKERDRLARELTDTRASHERAMTIARSQLADMKRQRETVTSDRVSGLQEANNRLRVRILTANRQLFSERQFLGEATERLAALLEDRIGMTSADAWELVSNAQFGEGGRVMRRTGGAKDARIARAVEALQGKRAPGDPLAALAEIAGQPVKMLSVKEARAGQAEIRAAIPEYPVIYTHDGQLGSLSVHEITGTGWVAIAAEGQGDDGITFIPSPEVAALAATVAAACGTGARCPEDDQV